MDDEKSEVPDSELWETAHKSENSFERADAWMELSHRRYHAYDYSEAIAYAEMAAKYYEEVERHDLVGNALYGQGLCLNSLKRFPEALEMFQRATEIWGSIGHEVWLADALHMSGEVQSSLGQPEESLILFESASRFYESCEYEGKAGNSLVEKGEILGALGRAAEAFDVFERARELYTKAEYFTGVGRANDRKASALIELGRLDEALDLLRENIELYTFLDAPWLLAHGQYRLGWTLNIDQQHGEALTWLNRAREFYDAEDRPHNRADVDAQRVLALRELGRRDDAESVGKGIRAFWRSVGNYGQLVLFEANRGLDLLGQGRGAEALDVLARARDLAREHCGDWTCRTIRLTYAEILVATGSPELAREALDSDEYTQWGDAIGSYCRHLIVLAHIAMVEGRPHEARGIAERVVKRAEPANLYGELGSAHEILATLAESEGEDSRSREYRAQAVACHLVAGHPSKATELAQRLLPVSNPSRRRDEWILMPSPSNDPNGEVMPDAERAPRSASDVSAASHPRRASRPDPVTNQESEPLPDRAPDSSDEVERDTEPDQTDRPSS